MQTREGRKYFRERRFFSSPSGMDKRAKRWHLLPMERMSIFIDKEVQRLIDSFAHCFRVKITIFSLKMEELIVGLQNPGAGFCRLIQKNLNGRYQCLRQDKMMCEQCRSKQELLVYDCYAGFTETVIPIRIENDLIGYAMLGQFRTHEIIPEELRQEWLRADFDPGLLQSAYMEQPFYNQADLDNMLHLFLMMITFIVTREYVRVRRPDFIASLVKWVEEHIREPTGLDELALAMNRSKSSISHSVKRYMGMSYKQLCIIKRIQRFESIIAEEPYISVQEAASRIGYDDPYYFSRVYKKARLMSPSAYIKSVRETRP
jgi:AraC-like DNA-binding protein/ligand-binding sensor protein